MKRILADLLMKSSHCLHVCLIYPTASDKRGGGFARQHLTTASHKKVGWFCSTASDEKRDWQNTDNQKKRILADLEEKLAKTEAKAEQYEARAHKVSQLVDRGHGLV